MAGKQSAEGVVLSSVGMWSSIWMRRTRGRPVGSGRMLGWTLTRVIKENTKDGELDVSGSQGAQLREDTRQTDQVR